MEIHQDRCSHHEKALEVSKFQTTENVIMEDEHTPKLGVVEHACSPRVFWKPKQEDCDFKGSLDYVVSHNLRKITC